VCKFAKLREEALQAIQYCLGLSRNDAKNVFKQGLRRYVELGMNFSLMSHCPHHLVRSLEETRVILAEDTLSLLRQERPILMVTMYMGNFPVGFMKLMQSVENQKKIFVFKFNAASAQEDKLFSLFRQTGQEISPLRASEDGGKRAFLELRRGGIVALMVDAEVHVTARENVSFFGQPCLMQSGPATLAVLSGAVVLPVINYVDSDGCNVVRVDPAIYPECLQGGRSPRERLRLLTQSIAHHMEQWIRIDPSQVQRWPSIMAIMRNRGERSSS
jgi:lauroyl/myristoyl acyltransferase